MHIAEPEIIADERCQTGENPLWHAAERRLYWTDIPKGKLFRYDPSSGRHEQCYSGDPVGGFTIQADGALLLFQAAGRVSLWRDGALEPVVSVNEAEADSRFNDVIADPRGRVFCGAMHTQNRKGRLYRLDTDGSLHRILDGIGTPNGMGFTPDRRRFYFTDSETRRIYLFDYDESTGEISNRRVWLETPAGEGVPDGLTVDADGHIWSARWDGAALYRYDPAGRMELRIPFPARKVSSVTFGGENLSDLYVTTALLDGSREEEGGGAGALFRLRTGLRGRAEFFSRVLMDGSASSSN